jgi:hypothetical protein
MRHRSCWGHDGRCTTNPRGVFEGALRALVASPSAEKGLAGLRLAVDLDVSKRAGRIHARTLTNDFKKHTRVHTHMQKNE